MSRGTVDQTDQAPVLLIQELGVSTKLPRASGAGQAIHVQSLEDVVLPDHSMRRIDWIHELSPSTPSVAPGNDASVEVAEKSN